MYPDFPVLSSTDEEKSGQKLQRDFPFNVPSVSVYVPDLSLS